MVGIIYKHIFLLVLDFEEENTFEYYVIATYDDLKSIIKRKSKYYVSILRFQVFLVIINLIVIVFNALTSCELSNQIKFFLCYIDTLNFGESVRITIRYVVFYYF